MTMLCNRRCCYLYALYWLGLLLAACTPDAPAPTPVAAVPLSTERWTATPTVQLESTATTTPLQPTATPTPIDPDTPRPSPTPRPINTPAPTTAFANHYDLPAWLNDPEATVLMLHTVTDWGDDLLLSFVNLSTGERFDLSGLGYTWNVGWGKDETGVYFQYLRRGEDGTDYREQVYIATGSVIQMPLETSSSHLGNLVPAPDGSYMARIVNNEENEDIVTIENEQTGEVVLLDDPFNNRYADFAYASWSPAGDFLAVLRVDYGEIPGDDPPATGLTIYNPQGDIYRWRHNVNGLRWARENSYQILYVESSHADNSQPCLYNIRKDTTSCITEIVNWRESRLLSTGAYSWGPENEQITFTYWSYSENRGGLCTISLQNGEIVCPVDDELLDAVTLAYDGVFVIRYSWSLDHDYLFLVLDPFGPESHDHSWSELATIRGDGGQLQRWGYGHEAFWRPSLSP